MVTKYNLLKCKLLFKWYYDYGKYDNILKEKWLKKFNK